MATAASLKSIDSLTGVDARMEALNRLERLADEAAKLTKEGKIPVHASWKDRVKAGTAGWDGILTAAALLSFTQDQQALDDRIARFV